MKAAPPHARALAPYHGLFTDRVRKARLAAALRHVPRGARVLDIGCGLADLAGRFPSYVGCDRNPFILEENRRRFPRDTFVAWDISNGAPPPAPIRPGSFDAILMLALLEHLDDPGAALARARALLAPSGRIVATTPHPLGRLPLEWGARWGWLSPHAAEEHEDLLSRNDLERLGREAGLSLASFHRFLLGLNQVAVFSAVSPGT